MSIDPTKMEIVKSQAEFKQWWKSSDGDGLYGEELAEAAWQAARAAPLSEQTVGRSIVDALEQACNAIENTIIHNYVQCSQCVSFLQRSLDKGRAALNGQPERELSGAEIDAASTAAFLAFKESEGPMIWTRVARAVAEAWGLQWSRGSDNA